MLIVFIAVDFKKDGALNHSVEKNIVKKKSEWGG